MDQLRAILADAGRYAHVVIGGDMNAVPDSRAAGTILNVHGASDHLAVWAVGILR